MKNSGEERIIVLRKRLSVLNRNLTDFAGNEMLDEEEEACSSCYGIRESGRNGKNCFELLNMPYLKSFFLQRLKGENLHGFVGLMEGKKGQGFDDPDSHVNKMLLGDYRELTDSITLVRERTYKWGCPIGAKVEGKIRRILYLVPADRMDYRSV